MKELETSVLCGSRTSQRTYNTFIRIYEYAKKNGYSDITIRFIEPEIIKLQERINKAIEYIESEYTITDDNVYLALYSSDGTLDKLEEILRGE